MLGEWERALRESGYKVTPTRQAVLRVLCENAGHGHFFPEEVLERGRSHCPGLSRATVYRTLEIMAALGFLRVLCDSAGNRYFVRADGGHHHLLCRGCNAVVPLPSCPVEGLAAEIADCYGYSLDGHLLELYGLCPACQRASKGRAPKQEVL